MRRWERLEENIGELAEQLRERAYVPGPYRFFTILDPKERLIAAAPFRDRVAQHALMNILDPLFERVQICHSYACRVAKGTQAAVLRAFRNTKGRRWFLKLDVRRYFDSIDHDVLKGMLARLIGDDAVLYALQAIIDSYRSAPDEGRRGLPIGNLTSQYFANHYLAGLDHRVLEVLRIDRYLRYMDDMVLWSDEKGALRSAYEDCECYAAETLHLELKPPILNRVAAGVPFCGFLIKPRGIFLLEKTKARYRRKQSGLLAAFSQGRIDESAYAERSLASSSHLAVARCRCFRYAVFRQSFFGHEPRETGRQLEQQRRQLHRVQSEQQQPEQQEQQHRVPCRLPQPELPS